MFVLFSVGCTKIDTTTIGEELIPAVDNIHTFETTLDVIATNFDDVPICDTVRRGDLHALGIISNDPYFGKSNANIYLELKPEVFPFKFKDHDTDSLFLDSAVLVLKYAYSFGDTNLLQKVQVYPLTNKFKVDSVYSTCDILDYRNILLGEQTYVPSALKDTVHAFRENAANQLRIPIDRTLIEDWIENKNAIFLSDSAFTSRFKGFAILADEATGGQALNYFNLSSNNTRLSLYMRSSKSGAKDTSVYDFPLTQNSGRANSIIRIRGNSEITQHLSHPVDGDSLVYVQTSPGNYVQLTMPALSTLSNRVIHRAELIVDELYSPNSMNDIFRVPAMLYIDTKDTAANKYIPIPCDFNAIEVQNGFRTLGGAAAKTVDDEGHQINRYVFNISRYVQNIVTDKIDNRTIRLRAPYYISNPEPYIDRCGQLISQFTYGLNNIADGRVKLNGTNNTPTRMRLHIVYSSL